MKKVDNLATEEKISGKEMERKRKMIHILVGIVGCFAIWKGRELPSQKKKSTFIHTVYSHVCSIGLASCLGLILFGVLQLSGVIEVENAQSWFIRSEKQ